MKQCKKLFTALDNLKSQLDRCELQLRELEKASRTIGQFVYTVRMDEQ